MSGDAGLVALQMVARQLRGAHQKCKAAPGYGQLTCPWPLVTEEDVNELHAMLAEAGFQVTPIGGSDGPDSAGDGDRVDPGPSRD
jgi:hypothetical protein